MLLFFAVRDQKPWGADVYVQSDLTLRLETIPDFKQKSLYT
jgi:hypothetical protein